MKKIGPFYKKVGSYLIYIVFFSLLSYLFGLIKFEIPGVEGAMSDLREIPLLISIFHAPVLLLTTCVSAISMLGVAPDAPYLTSFLMHAIGLAFGWLAYQRIRRIKIRSIFLGFIWFFFVFIYYGVFLIPLLIALNNLLGLNLDRMFFSLYLELIISFRFEIIASAVVSAIYLVQFNLRYELRKHKEDLEILVKDRTNELESALEELKITQQQLVMKEKMASLGTLTSGIAHEINNPLNFIQGGLHICEDLEKETTTEQTKDPEKNFGVALKMMKSGLERVTEIVKSLMTFSSRTEQVKVDYNIHQIIDNTFLFMKNRISSDTLIEKDYRLESEIPIYPDKIHQVMMAVIDNAIYATENQDDGKKLIRITTRKVSNQAQITVFNNGPLISKSHMSQLFDPFFTTKDPGKGIGLGLSIAYTLINEHGGHITVKNKEEGVCVYIELPLKQ